jgi:hypothetical protein
MSAPLDGEGPPRSAQIRDFAPQGLDIALMELNLVAEGLEPLRRPRRIAVGAVARGRLLVKFAPGRVRLRCSVLSSWSRMRRRSPSRAFWVPESTRGKPAAPADAPLWGASTGAGRASPLPPGTEETAWSRARVVQPFPGPRLLV